MLTDLLNQASAKHRERPALFVDKVTFTYAELLSAAAGFTRTLEDHVGAEVSRTIPVAILGNKGATSYMGCFYAMATGRPYVPLNPKFPVSRSLHAIRESGCGIVILDGKYAIKYKDVVESLSEEIIVVCRASEKEKIDALGLTLSCTLLFSDALEGQSPVAPLSPQASDLSYVMFTSGTTGLPKGVPINLGNVSHYVQSILDLYDIDETSRMSQTFDLTFDLSVHDMFVTWASGACLVSFSEGAMLAPVMLCRKANVTHWFSVPTVAAMCNTLGLLKPDSLPDLKVSIFCGEALPTSVAKAWAKAATNSVIENIYGPTEATIAFTRFAFDPNENLPATVPIGEVFGDNQTRIVAPDSDDFADCEEGELLLGGPQLSSGYLNDPVKTAKAFVTDPADKMIWYRTGDRVVRQSDGRIDYVGRLDSQIKFKGYRIELSEIEQALRTAFGTDTAAAFAVRAETGEITRLGGAIATPDHKGEPVLMAGIKETLLQHLPVYMVPDAVFELGELPTNTNGKIDRNSLAKLF